MKGLLSERFGPPLAAFEKHWRVLNIALLPAALIALAWVEPGAPPKWFPFATSCGAITGLPCIFCGTTRALHHLLRGEFGRALYFNWLSYPFLAGALALLFCNALELLFGRNFLTHLPRPRLTRARGIVFAAGVVLLWGLQVYLAVSQHKTELLNPNGPLYSLVCGRH
ncbi:MAG: DUF2752 domain-containing protein [Chthoniobacterales bacterium]